MRLDQLLVYQKKFISRTKAQRAIKEGRISLANGQTIKKVSFDLPITVNLTVRPSEEYVSRGAYKLLKAISEFHLDFKNRLVLDIGASTGGFTQVALQHGAKQVYAVDVGNKQLAPKIAENSRVIIKENYNFRYAQSSDFPLEKFDLIQCDVSFISLRLIIPPAAKLLKHNGQAVFLIKPQFEAGKSYLNKKGVVKDRKVHLMVLKKIINYLKDNNLALAGLTYSPIKGQEGNQEFLALVEKNLDQDLNFSDQQLKEIIDQAQQNN